MAELLALVCFVLSAAVVEARLDGEILSFNREGQPVQSFRTIKMLWYRHLLSATATPARLTVGTQETGMVLFLPPSFSLHILPMEAVRPEAPQPDIPEVPVLPVLQVLMDMLK